MFDHNGYPTFFLSREQYNILYKTSSIKKKIYVFIFIAMSVGLLSSILKTYVGICPMGKSIKKPAKKRKLTLFFPNFGK